MIVELEDGTSVIAIDALTLTCEAIVARLYVDVADSITRAFAVPGGDAPLFAVYTKDKLEFSFLGVKLAIALQGGRITAADNMALPLMLRSYIQRIISAL